VSGALKLLPETKPRVRVSNMKPAAPSKRLSLVVPPLQFPSRIFFAQNLAQLLHLHGEEELAASGGGKRRDPREMGSNLQLQRFNAQLHGVAAGLRCQHRSQRALLLLRALAARH
jgi:hypothetical protein